MDSGVLAALITCVSVAVITPFVSWLVTRRATNSRVKVDQFTAITDAQDKRIDDLVEQVSALEAKVAARDDALAAANTENLTLRETLAALKGTVQRYFQSVADAWYLGGRMPKPDPADLAWLELTIPPPATPAEHTEKEGA